MRPLTLELFDLMDNGVGLCSVDTLEVLEANSALIAWLGLGPDENYLSDLINAEDLVRIKRSIEKKRKYRFCQTYLIHSREDTIEFICSTILLSDNQEFLLIQASVNNSDKYLKALVKNHAILLEKNNQLLLEQKLKAEAASRAKDLFLAAMSHELRTPLNGILGMVQQLGKSCLTNSQGHYLETINCSGQQLLAVINQVLDYSKIESSELVLHSVVTDLASIMTQVSKICSDQLLSDNNVEIHTQISPDIPLVMVDDIRLKQILINLVNNALKFTHRGQVSLILELRSTTSKSCELTFKVVDTGIGISEERIEYIFDPFIQHSFSTTREYGGTGLGLSICKQLVDKMGGTINVTSQPNVGSQFMINLSLDISHDIIVSEGHSLEKKCSHDVSIIKGKRILIVDDIALNREIIRMPLEELDTQLYLAENGVQAVELFKKHDIDLILMDCLMPVMDGFDATKAIRKMEVNGNRVPIFAVTASVSEEVTQTCKLAGMDEVMLKPFDFDQLIKKICFRLMH
ncbi:signal transduction histidine kinase [Shewanella psychrophila]|uniref:histidine kinase n=1 Tax=Shewanella psychrophila TaxID=225848 RepID=A0A1S6HUH0_9GAMM|nr:ATP-binding protein [Shewanella psychrophila]AQS39195.1 signal transduction histidine kinase [Shewanella psychrophila]